MLVLQRKEDQTVKLFVPGYPDPIIVEVVRIRGPYVRLGFQAPADVVIERDDAVKDRFGKVIQNGGKTLA